MRTFICFSALAVVVLAQFTRPSWFDQLAGNLNNNMADTIDTVHEYRFEYHDNSGTHLIIAISDKNGMRECHFIEIDSQWEPLLKDNDKMKMITEEIYHLLDTHTAQETSLSNTEIIRKYGDRD